MNPVRTQIHFLPSHRSVLRAFRTGVSLHSHTELSQEELSGLPRHLERMPVVSHFFCREIERYRAKTGQPVDFSRAYWRGPLDAHSAHELEKRIARLQEEIARCNAAIKDRQATKSAAESFFKK